MRSFVSIWLAVSILLVWIVSALAYQQSLIADQSRASLLHLGAVDGAHFRLDQWWRLIAAQWLHVKAAHMLFNAISVAVAGAVVERRSGATATFVIFLIGGAAGLVASVLAYPDLLSSGASQGLLALCGAAGVLLLERRARIAIIAVGAITALQLALDLQSAHTVKSGHAVGLGFGVAAGVALARRLRKPQATRPERA